MSHCLCVDAPISYSVVQMCVDFTNTANKSKIVDRLKQMCSVFDRQCLIIEKDPTKNWEKDAGFKPLLVFLAHLPYVLAFFI